ncbi:uncharacterized protein [Temnothorax longispinosus]|uniref:uncharacterized protein isoform X3 n=1 Tax=Temnothorax longispinosus TaxID=300112 RepID=UPI003A99AE72
MTSRRTINRTVQLMLIMFGYWPGISCVVLYRVFWMIMVGITEFCHCHYLVVHFRFHNLFDLMDCLTSFLAFIKLFSKLFIFWLKQRKFFEILTMTAEDWNDCDNTGVELRETAKKAKLSSRIGNGIIILQTMATLAYVIGIFQASIDVDVTDRTVELPLIFKMEYPFVIDTQRKYRLTLHVGSQINILICWLGEVGSKDIEKTHDRHDSFVTVITKIVRKHQKIIYLSENIENLYSYIALVQFISNTVMICSLGFLVVTAIGSPDASEQITRSLLFYVVTSLEAFVFCFAGEYLSNKYYHHTDQRPTIIILMVQQNYFQFCIKSKAIGNAAYNSAWYDMKAKDRRVLLFIILRSQRQLQFTAGKMAVLSLEYFTTIMKASGSYLSVLLAMK